jgi:thioredoxin-dependent peroxiredoxin
MNRPAIGQPVADFALPATGNQTIRLSDLRGKWVVLYFYPKDCTSGCTLEGQNFRDRHTEFNAANTVILGVSRDTLKLHEKFKAAEGFPFELLADTERQLCQQFDVMKEKTMYGKKVTGIDRSTFIIDTAGNLVREWRGVKVPGHVDEVLAALQQLNSQG